MYPINVPVMSQLPCGCFRRPDRLTHPARPALSPRPQRRYGNSVVIHLHHMEPRMAERILARHRSTASIFSDEIQASHWEHLNLAAERPGEGGLRGRCHGVGPRPQAFPATVLAGLMAAAPLTDRTLESHTFMVVGDGDMPAHLAEMITYHLARTKGLPAASVRQQVFLVDSGGVLNRARANTLSEAQLLYANVGESGERTPIISADVPTFVTFCALCRVLDMPLASRGTGPRSHRMHVSPVPHHLRAATRSGDAGGGRQEVQALGADWLLAQQPGRGGVAVQPPLQRDHLRGDGGPQPTAHHLLAFHPRARRPRRGEPTTYSHQPHESARPMPSRPRSRPVPT